MEALSEVKDTGSVSDPFLASLQRWPYWDPTQPLPNPNPIRKTKPFKQVIVFMVGGGNYAEYHGLQQLAQKLGKQLIYGATDLVSPDQFVDQLHALAELENKK